jgi:hypothetical protein
LKNAEAVAEAAELGSFVVQHSGHSKGVVLAVLVDEGPFSSPSAALLNHELQSGQSLTLHAILTVLSNSAETPASFELPGPLAP